MVLTATDCMLETERQIAMEEHVQIAEVVEVELHASAVALDNHLVQLVEVRRGWLVGMVRMS